VGQSRLGVYSWDECHNNAPSLKSDDKCLPDEGQEWCWARV
jgi:hypothetical protein